MLEIKGLQSVVLHRKRIARPTSAAATQRGRQMTYSEFMLAHGLPVNSPPQLGGRGKKAGVCLQPLPPARLGLSLTPHPAPAVSRPPGDSS